MAASLFKALPLIIGSLLALSSVGCKESRAPIPEGFPMEARAAELAQGVYYDKGCAGCHILDGRGGKMGPSLQGIGSRQDREWIKAYIRDPQGVFRRSSMPRVEMNEAELEAITQFLAAHR